MGSGKGFERQGERYRGLRRGVKGRGSGVTDNGARGCRWRWVQRSRGEGEGAWREGREEG